MKFYQGLLPRIIWDASSGKSLAEFGLDGTLETDDEDLIKLLRGKGYLLDVDLGILEATGRLPHGGFEKTPIDSKLPSHRPPVEDDSNIYGTGKLVRPRSDGVIPDAAPAAAPLFDVDDLSSEGVSEASKPTRKRVSSTTKSSSKRKIKRRKKSK